MMLNIHHDVRKVSREKSDRKCFVNLYRLHVSYYTSSCFPFHFESVLSKAVTQLNLSMNERVWSLAIAVSEIKDRSFLTNGVRVTFYTRELAGTCM